MNKKCYFNLLKMLSFEELTASLEEFNFSGSYYDQPFEKIRYMEKIIKSFVIHLPRSKEMIYKCPKMILTLFEIEGVGKKYYNNSPLIISLFVKLIYYNNLNEIEKINSIISRPDFEEDEYDIIILLSNCEKLFPFCKLLVDLLKNEKMSFVKRLEYYPLEKLNFIGDINNIIHNNNDYRKLLHPLKLPSVYPREIVTKLMDECPLELALPFNKYSNYIEELYGDKFDLGKMIELTCISEDEEEIDFVLKILKKNKKMDLLNNLKKISPTFKIKMLQN